MRIHRINKFILKILSCSVLVVSVFLYLNRKDGKDKRTVVNIAVMQNNLVHNYNTNYYTGWLEKKTGFDINFEYISEGYEKEYLRAMLNQERGRIDAVFLPGETELISEEELEQYIQEGLIYNMSEFVTENSNIKEIKKEYASKIQKTDMAYDDGIYYMPRMDINRKNQNMQVLWINLGWLKKLSLEVPETTEDFEEVLRAFKTMDPNGNGRNDEIPLISNESSYTLQSYNYLLNAYIYNDPYHMRMCAGENGELYDASIQPAFREGLSYCARLYKEGLLSKSCVSFSKRQLQELLNSSDDVVGAFSSQSIADIIYPNCSDILARFIQVPPLKGPDGEQYAVHVNSEIQIGGYIPSNAIHKKEAFEIMDLMLSTDASLIASFGEEGVDWRQSDSGELSSYGSKAKVTTLNYLNDKVQNKHFAGSGPMVLSLEYANGVTWNGNSSLVQYIDARAVRLYEKYYYDKMELYSHNKLISQGEVTKIQSFTNDWIYRFIFGLEEIDSDEVWEGYIRERSKLD